MLLFVLSVLQIQFFILSSTLSNIIFFSILYFVLIVNLHFYNSRSYIYFPLNRSEVTMNILQLFLPNISFKPSKFYSSSDYTPVRAGSQVTIKLTSLPSTPSPTTPSCTPIPLLSPPSLTTLPPNLTPSYSLIKSGILLVSSIILFECRAAFECTGNKFNYNAGEEEGREVRLVKKK